ncbi:hypothetical protein [Marinicella sp. W31]|uniref:hypothetical protein n=1 Tax=Marinicella sp. W31 TaxID=3023713 RepID=UPI003756AB64
MPQLILDIAGWLPAIIFPTATFIQIWAIIKTRSTNGVSAMTWFLFGIANIGVYIYTEKYGDLQSIFGFLGTALLDFVIVAMVWMRFGQATKT